MDENLEFKIDESKVLINLIPKCKPFYAIKEIGEEKVNSLKCNAGEEYKQCDQRLFYLEDCFCKLAIDENSKTKEVYNKFLKLEGW